MTHHSHEIQLRTFVSDIIDGDKPLELKVSIDEVVWEDGFTEHQNEDFELNGEFVTYAELVDRFGKGKVDAFVEEATQNAR